MIKKHSTILLTTAVLLTSLAHATAKKTAGEPEMVFQIAPYESLLNKDIQRGDKNSEAFKKIKKDWGRSSPIPLYRLKVVTFSYVDFNGKQHQNGECVVMDAVAPRVLTIFKELYKRQFPIHQAKRIEFFGADDDRSIDANNSSSYNARTNIGDSSYPSMHAYGLAIDINPVQNPFHSFKNDAAKKQGIRQTKPAAGSEQYINRRRARNDKLPGLAEGIIDIFDNNGFNTWGGDWNDPIDWQHFQTSRALANLLTVMSPQDAEVFFEMHAETPALMRTFPAKETLLIDLYQENPEKFMAIFIANPSLFSLSDKDQAIRSINKQWEKIA
ncbi:MAG TPA: hypothetical protein DD412_02705 [Holosporales bacterium]|nr:hypothetical protein [Holosporales bacterium]